MLPKLAVFSSSYRGRIGKSFFGGHYVDYLERNAPDVPFAAFDPDNVNSALTHFYPKAKGVDFKDPIELDRILSTLDHVPLVFCDGLGGHYENLAGWMNDINLFEIARASGIAITFVLLITDNVDTIKHAAEVLKNTPEEVHFLIVQNRHFAPTNIWAKTDARKKFISRGAVEIELPRNHCHIELLFDNLKKPAFSLAAKEGITATDHQRFLNLGRKMDQIFKSAESVLLPSKAAAGKSRVAASSTSHD